MFRLIFSESFIGLSLKMFWIAHFKVGALLLIMRKGEKQKPLLLIFELFKRLEIFTQYSCCPYVAICTVALQK